MQKLELVTPSKPILNRPVMSKNKYRILITVKLEYSNNSCCFKFIVTEYSRCFLADSLNVET